MLHKGFIGSVVPLIIHTLKECNKGIHKNEEKLVNLYQIEVKLQGSELLNIRRCMSEAAFLTVLSIVD